MVCNKTSNIGAVAVIRSREIETQVACACTTGIRRDSAVVCVHDWYQDEIALSCAVCDSLSGEDNLCESYHGHLYIAH